MKKLSTLLRSAALLLSLQSTAVYAQDTLTCGLNMTPLSRTYNYLSDATAVDVIETDDAFKNNIPLGFNFVFGNCGGISYSVVHVSSNGLLKFGAPLSNSYPNTTSVVAANLPALWPLWTNLSGMGGTASYKTEVIPSTGTKVFTMEWKDWRWNNTATSANISFQVKLYEGSNLVEYCYKQEAGTVPAVSNPAQIGMARRVASGSSATCPSGWDYTIFTDASATPVLNTSGLIGAAISTRPATDQVFQLYYKCCGKPNAGEIIRPDSVCSGAPFTAVLSGATPAPFGAYGITYLWQSAAAATGPWTSLLVTGPSFTFPTGITNETFLRVVVECAASGEKDTTPVHRIKMITLPYNCYCYSSAANNPVLPDLVNIGNVKLLTGSGDKLIDTAIITGTVLSNNGPYVDYTLWTGNRPIPEINRDTTYKWSVTGITKNDLAFPPSGVALYIDYNGDREYNASSELAGFQVLSGTTVKFTRNITVPADAVHGIAGLRVVMKKGATTPADISPCGGYSEGETEDFIVNITNPKCGGPLMPGTSYISDTSICPGYYTTLTNTSHERNTSAMHWQWEYSLDHIHWADVSGGRMKDELKPVVRQTTWYRLRMVCESTRDTTYSNEVNIKLKQPYKCYCYSLADGNEGSSFKDTADITAVELDKFVLNSGGPHLLNPASLRMRTDNTHLDPIELTTGSSYPIAVYHTLYGKYHSNAKVTVFMDFNRDLTYDATERIWSATTTATSFYIHDFITIPLSAIPDEPLGMRVILNSNTGANSPSDDGCGVYTSGETEDYMVIFRRASTGVGSITHISNLQVFPNPADGQFTLSFSAAAGVKEAAVRITNITGQQVFTERYDQVGPSFSRNINLKGHAAGVYFVTLTVDGQSSVQKVMLK